MGGATVLQSGPVRTGVGGGGGGVNGCERVRVGVGACIYMFERACMRADVCVCVCRCVGV
jgi:hypothetical protein